MAAGRLLDACAAMPCASGVTSSGHRAGLQASGWRKIFSVLLPHLHGMGRQMCQEAKRG